MLFLNEFFTLPETNSSSHLKMDGWKMNFPLGWPNFRGELLVSGRKNHLPTIHFQKETIVSIPTIHFEV